MVDLQVISECLLTIAKALPGPVCTKFFLGYAFESKLTLNSYQARKLNSNIFQKIVKVVLSNLRFHGSYKKLNHIVINMPFSLYNMHISFIQLP